MADEGDSPPPQWATDPTRRHDFRYWDGRRWTDHVSDGHGPPQDPPAEHAEAAPVVAQPQPDPEPEPTPTATATATVSRARRHSPPPSGSASGKWFVLGALVGAIVVGAAVAVAVVAFKVKVNNDSSTSVRSSSSTTSPASTTTTAPATTTTTAPANPGRPPAQVHVQVLNGAGTPKGASTKALALGALGYKIVAVGDAPARQGTVVECKAGFEAEAATLATNVGPGTTTAPYPTPAPVGSTADCIVVLGK